MKRVCGCGCVLSHCPCCRGGKKSTYKLGAKQGHEGQKQSRHVVSLLPSIVLAEAARDFLYFILEISSIWSALLTLPLSGCQLSLPPFFFFFFLHPGFLPTHHKSNELYASYILTVYLLTFLLIQLVWFATSLVLHKLPFLTAIAEGGGSVRRSKLRQIGTATCPIELFVCLLLIRRRRPEHQPASLQLKKLYLLCWLTENALQCVGFRLQNFSERLWCKRQANC